MSMKTSKDTTQKAQNTAKYYAGNSVHIAGVTGSSPVSSTKFSAISDQFSTVLFGTSYQRPAFGRGDAHSLGKGEVECSIHSVGTIKSPPFLPFTPMHIAPDVLVNAEPCANMRLKRCSSRGKSGEYVPHRFGR